VQLFDVRIDESAVSRAANFDESRQVPLDTTAFPQRPAWWCIGQSLNAPIAHGGAQFGPVFVKIV
jgi:hypothetical protein